MAAPVKACTIIDVEVVDAGGSDSDQNLADFWLRRRNVFVAEHVRAAQLMYADCSHQSVSRLLKKPHRLRCARSPRVNVLPMYAFARRFFARLASDAF
jgi:hypothetical protein